MSSPKSVPPALAPAMLWLDATVKVVEMLTASSQVISHRTRLMMNSAGAVPNAADCAELTLMGSEKFVACVDVAGRAARGWSSFGQQWAQAWLGALAKPQAVQANFEQALALSSAAARFSSDVLHPVHGKATANARRLAAVERRRISKQLRSASPGQARA
jgi:hypothetical protein